ncbi:adenylate/guanylate cyclase [Streptosporangium subroseum]|uniref:Adenylate/guanylate cyclase n=1 Tax=Streptosporangium subroseum TaxID=106412 RepID=A0A239MU42_9ACTN|nr:AAA family ATPase [Streptosporangium subroseum]SNT45644.1 adenylate/guanylate cyclase [Streptosporangium subroseum]
MTATLVIPESTDAMRGVPLEGPLRLQVLGPLRVWRGESELEAGPRQQAYLLALLLARGGRPTGTGELIDLIWGEDAPASALNVIHKYVGLLRRLLEPDLPPRGTGAYLLKRGNGYLCAAGADLLDLTRFRQQSGAARTARAEGHDSAALDHYLYALRLWSGPAGDGWVHGPAAAPIFAGLNDEYFQACIEAASVALMLGQPTRVLPALHLAAAMAPLHEPVQASLITLLGGAGQQAEALAVFNAVRRRLTEDLGIDPGKALKAAHQRVLTQTPATQASAAQTPVTEPSGAPAPSLPPASPTPPSGDVNRLVGRSDEIAVLRRAVEPALESSTAVVLLEGEPGAGKSRLMEEIASHAEDRGALVVWGHCLEGEGTPTMWPWVETVSSLLDVMPEARCEQWLARDLGHLVGSRVERSEAPTIPDGNARFRLLEQVVGLIAEAAGERPVVMMIDDLQWADTSSLQLLDHVISRLPAGTAVVGALRNRGPSPSLELVRTLAAASRATGHRRLLVGPMSPAEVAELIHLETGVRLAPDVATSVHTRTAGNPFFVQELGRLWGAGSELTTETVLRGTVPMTVRDVVRDRLAVLDGDAQELLEIAALVGQSVELALLARMASLDVGSCLDRLEPVRSLGLVGPTPGDPFSYRFTHDLVRQAVSEAIPPGRATALHGSIADAIEEVGLSDESVAERVAHHLWSAGPVADPARTVAALVRAGARAKAKTALAAAERHLGSAVELARRASLLELELRALSQLIAVVGMRSMYGTASVSLLERAEQIAQRLGRDREAAGFLFSRWTAHGQALDLDRSSPLARRLEELGRTSEDPVVRCYGRAAAGIHEWCLGNIGESFQRLSALSLDLLSDHDEEHRDSVRDGVQLMAAGMFAEIAGYHGQTAQARAVLDTLSKAAGDDPYAVTAATSFEARTASVVGDPDWALRAAERGIAADPHFSFASLGTYLRLARCWALATTGQDPAAAADEAERLIRTNLASPARTCVSTWYALLGEMRIAAGSLDKAAAALDSAEEYLERYGQRSAEALLVLVRAQLEHAAGDDRAAVRLADQARTVALRQGAHLFVQRADRFLAELGGETPMGAAVQDLSALRPPGTHRFST